MAKTAVLQIRIDEEDKVAAEQLFESMGTSLSEAVRMFVKQSIIEQRLVFIPSSLESKGKCKAFGCLKTYASPSKIVKERQAWIRSLGAKPKESE